MTSFGVRSAVFTEEGEGIVGVPHFYLFKLVSNLFTKIFLFSVILFSSVGSILQRRTFGKEKLPPCGRADLQLPDDEAT